MRAGACANASALCASADEVLAAMAAWLKKDQRPSFIPNAPGGGTENVGVVQAVNDMLVQAPGGKFIQLFPVWPKTQHAAFRRLLAKGECGFVCVRLYFFWSCIYVHVYVYVYVYSRGKILTHACIGTMYAHTHISNIYIKHTSNIYKHTMHPNIYQCVPIYTRMYSYRPICTRIYLKMHV